VQRHRDRASVLLRIVQIAHLRTSTLTIAFMAKRSPTGRHADDCLVAKAIASQSVGGRRKRSSAHDAAGR
jgi:hypothetical protein